MADMDYKAKFTQGADVLQALFEDGKSPLSGPYLRWKLWARWGEIVGETIAKSSEPVAFSRGTLWIWVSNSAWMQQMIFMREDMRKTINSKIGVEFVRTIRLTLDRREVPSNNEEQEAIREGMGKIAPKRTDRR